MPPSSEIGTYRLWKILQNREGLQGVSPTGQKTIVFRVGHFANGNLTVAQALPLVMGAIDRLSGENTPAEFVPHVVASHTTMLMVAVVGLTLAYTLKG